MSLDDSILSTLRPLCNLEENDNSFDDQLIPYINLGIGRLNELGCGTSGFLITGESETWNDLISETPRLLPQVSTFLSSYARANGFDTPSGSQLNASLKNTVDKLEWSIKWECETYDEVSYGNSK